MTLAIASGAGQAGAPGEEETLGSRELRARGSGLFRFLLTRQEFVLRFHGRRGHEDPLG